MRRRVMTVVGTRPELIRLSRTIALLDEVADHTLVHTGQNSDPQLSDVFFSDLGIRQPDRYLGISGASLGAALGDVMTGTEQAIRDFDPEAVLVLGDTNSALSTIIAKRMHVPVYHWEAGNRSFDANVPEETNRRLVDHIADFNLPYSESARRNLLAEGLPPRRIALTGSPMREVLDHYADRIAASDVLARLELAPGEYFVVSAHRQENVDDPDRLRRLMETLRALVERYRIPVLVSTHPRTRARLDAIAGGASIDGVVFHPPFGFLDYIALQKSSRCVLSDSGTISEESAIVGFPAVTIRDSMERPEALETGAILMTGLDADEVLPAVEAVLGQGLVEVPSEYQVRNASWRLVSFLLSTVGRTHAWDGIRTPSPA